ncbi:glucose dehydrogenase [Endozoicomonas montiporae]|uniref:Glucose dehydrogenase n=2 Tax=Endozoicomonas montiporae TaxID=1027273 RepID=A0A081N4I5_9GAMM|nr:glucose dehydrogenase [Endozoicomonas montiporae]
MTLIYLVMMAATVRSSPVPSGSSYTLSTLVSELESPWSMAFLPDQSLLVTERSGQLRRISDGKVSEPVEGVPEVFFRGQGGLLDIKLHPDYEKNGWLYLSYAHGNRDANALRLMRAKLQGLKLVEQQVLFTVTPAKNTPVHYGGRILFLPDQTLLLSTGDGYNFRESSQKKNSLIGKIVRLNDDGSIPEDNPFVGEKGTHSAIWSLGHRNPQGLFYDSRRKQVISHEHGPKGGDEINIIEPGKNYGWPVITYGRDYTGATITPYKEYPGMEQPFVDWTPSIAPSSLVVYYGAMFPELKGDLLATTLVSREVRRVRMDGNNVSGQESLISTPEQRLRHIEVDRKGAIYLLTDQGDLLKVTKQQSPEK